MGGVCRRRSGDGAGESRDFQPAVAQARVRRRRDSRGQTQTRERERWDVRRPGAALDDGGHPRRGARFPRGFRPAPGGRRFEPCGPRARDARRVLRQASASVHVHARGPRGGGAPATRGARIRGDGRASRPGVARAALRAQQRQGGQPRRPRVQALLLARREAVRERRRHRRARAGLQAALGGGGGRSREVARAGGAGAHRGRGVLQGGSRRASRAHQAGV